MGLRELDVWIADNVFGIKSSFVKGQPCGWQDGKPVLWSPNDFVELDASREYTYRIPGGWGFCIVSKYTTDPAAAMGVLKKCLENNNYFTVGNDEGTFKLESRHIDGRRILIEAESLELAICLFAKKLFGGGK